MKKKTTLKMKEGPWYNDHEPQEVGIVTEMSSDAMFDAYSRLAPLPYPSIVRVRGDE